jgi:hypothetical protein
MKLKQLLPLLFIVIISIQNAIGQDNTEISNALSNGNSKVLAKYFNENIDLKIPGTDGVFNKMQAELILKDFFSQNKITEYEVKHEGKSKNDSYYLIGEMALSNEKYRTYILLKKKDNSFKILEFNIELDE